MSGTTVSQLRYYRCTICPEERSKGEKRPATSAFSLPPRVMAPWSELPAELVLIALERVAWDEVPLRKAWVASTRLVSRTACALVTPILFDTLVVNQGNRHAMVALAGRPDSPMSLVRSLILGFMDTIAWRNAILGPLRAQRLRSYSGPIEWFDGLVEMHPDVAARLSCIHITSPGHRASEFGGQVAAVPRLHINAPLALRLDWDFAEMRTQYLVLDVRSRDPADAVAPFLRIPSLRRVLVRLVQETPRAPKPATREVFIQNLEALRDVRVWGNVVHRFPFSVEDHFLRYDDMDAAAALAGDDFWLGGEPACSAPACDAPIPLV